MPSRALARWESERTGRLTELFNAHRRTEGDGSRGRRWHTKQLNRMLVIALASEFQGFCRDLHDEAVEVVVRHATTGSPAIGRVLASLLREGRQLDKVNAHPGSLGSDFQRFGMDLWPNLKAQDPSTQTRQMQLTRLNKARNAIAHANESEIDDLANEGFPITLSTVRLWHRSMRGLANTMDQTLATHLTIMTGAGPW